MIKILHDPVAVGEDGVEVPEGFPTWPFVLFQDLHPPDVPAQEDSGEARVSQQLFRSADETSFASMSIAASSLASTN